MTGDSIKEAKAEAIRFLKRVEAYEAKYPIDKNRNWIPASKESGAVKRASMDLTRSLAELRK